MQTLYILQFNNYYNRQIKKYNTIAEYINNATVVDTITNTDFYKNDGVNTSILIPEVYNVAPDYCVVYDNGSQSIESRWFIMETKFNSGTQYRAQLYRDLVADFYDDFINAPAFIEKATLTRNNNLIFNNEDMGFNQIKTNEYLLKDFTRISWIVGYVARNWEGGTITVPTDTSVNISGYYSSFDNYPYNQYTNTPFKGFIRNTVYQLKSYITTASTNVLQRNFSWGYTGSRKNPLIYTGNLISTGIEQEVTTTKIGYKNESPVDATITMLNLEVPAQAQGDWSATAGINTIAGTNTALATENFLALEGTIIQVGESFYKVHIAKTNTTKNSFTVDPTTALGLKFNTVKNYYSGYFVSPLQGSAYYLQGEIDEYTLTYEELDIESYSVIIPATRARANDAPYDIFTLPLPSFDGIFYYNTNEGAHRVNNTSVLKLTQQLQLIGGSNIYDIQLLPYCPIKNLINYSSTYYNYLDLNDVNGIYFQEFSSKNGAIVWCTESSFEINIEPYSDFYTTYTVPTPSNNSIDFKVEHECDFYRMVSPNYNGTFEIKSTSNDGLTNFTATCAYKPFTPYIKVSPQFNRLYGQDFNDARGLILGGDFSLPAITDSWIEYQIQNKNYQVIFDRQIENLEFNNNLSLRQKQISGAMSAATMGVTGGIMGAQAGGVYGTLAGAAVGTITSGIGAAMDIDILKKQQAETLDYTKDQFGYNLSNIAARPQSLTKVSSFNPNNKIFPILEYYTCTNEEKEALRNKIKYNGMTVMAIGTVADYQLLEPSYIKARLIRLETINADYHEALALAEEMNKGVFI